MMHELFDNIMTLFNRVVVCGIRIISQKIVKHILLGIQELLNTPNWSDPANQAPCVVFRNEGKAAYEAKVKEEAKKYST